MSIRFLSVIKHGTIHYVLSNYKYYTTIYNKSMKNLALDLGDAWVGTALSDRLGIIASPHTTVAANDLDSFLVTIFAKEPIGRVIVGNPITLRGTTSSQTAKVHALFERLKAQYTTVEWVLWDERLSSRQAEAIRQSKNKADKRQAHSRAAAVILDSYLQYLHFLSNTQNSD
jgi:putative holliday junction resolvase